MMNVPGIIKVENTSLPNNERRTFLIPSNKTKQKHQERGVQVQNENAIIQKKDKQTRRLYFVGMEWTKGRKKKIKVIERSFLINDLE